MEFRQFIETNKDGLVNITDDIAYSLTEEIAEINRLKHGVFESPKYPNGEDKFFYNIGHIMKQTAFRGSNMGTKDLEMHAETEQAIKVSPIFKAAVKQYLKDTDFDTVMNKDRDMFIDGHLLTKQIDNETHHVRLENIIRPAHIMDFSGGIAEKTFPKYDEIESYKGDWDNWEKVSEVKEKIDRDGGVMVVYEYWRWKGDTIVCEKWLDMEPLTPTKKQDLKDWEPFVKLDEFKTPYRKKIRGKRKIKKLIERGIIKAGDDSVPDFPYKERRFITLDGRWLGVGVWKLLAQVMEHYNENWGNKRMFDQLANKGITVLQKGQGNDSQSLTQDFVNNLPFGGILEIENDETLSRLQMGSITLDHMQTVDKLFELARQLLGLTASVVNEDTSQKTAYEVSVDRENAKSTYQIITEELSLYYQELFNDIKLEDIIDNMSEEEWVKAAGGKHELEEAEQIFLENSINSQLKENAQNGIFSPGASRIPDDEYNRIIQAAKVIRWQQGGSRFVQITDKLKEFFKFNVEFFVRNETFDKLETLKQYDGLIAYSQSNPMSSISAEKVIEAKMELLDMPVNRFKKTPQEMQEAMQMMQQQQIQMPNPVPQQ